MPLEPSQNPSADDWQTIYDLLGGRVELRGECWEFTGSRQPHGYGQLRRNYKLWLAHRYVWQHAVSDIGSMYVLHHCDNPPCVRPSHLWLGTQTDNNRDREEKGRGTKPPMRWDGIHCKRGHVIADNPYFDPNTGTRRCKTCMNEKSRRWMAEHKRR